jgi:hypothetical protein
VESVRILKIVRAFRRRQWRRSLGLNAPPAQENANWKKYYGKVYGYWKKKAAILPTKNKKREKWPMGNLYSPGIG